MGSLLDYPVEIQGQGTLLNSGFKLESDMFQEGRNAGLEVLIRLPVKGKLAERRIAHGRNNIDAPVIVIEIKAVHLLPVILPHNALIREHLFDELRKLEPDGDGFTDREVAVSTLGAGIHDDALILLTELGVKRALKINGSRAGKVVEHNSILAVSHILTTLILLVSALF